MPEAGRQRKNLLFSGHRCRRLADNGKINHEKGMSGAAAWAFPFRMKFAKAASSGGGHLLLDSTYRGYCYGQKKGNSDHDKGGCAVSKGAGRPETSISLWNTGRGQEAATGGGKQVVYSKRV